MKMIFQCLMLKIQKCIAGRSRKDKNFLSIHWFQHATMPEKTSIMFDWLIWAENTFLVIYLLLPLNMSFVPKTAVCIGAVVFALLSEVNLHSSEKFTTDEMLIFFYERVLWIRNQEYMISLVCEYYEHVQ